MAKNDGTRLIERGSCSWCGHRPHGDEKCPNQIQVATKNSKSITEPCPCKKRVSA